MKGTDMVEDNLDVLVEEREIHDMIYTFRGKQVMVDNVCSISELKQ